MSDDQIAAVLAALERLEQGQASLRADLSERLDRQQDALTAIRDDIAVTMNSANRAIEVNDHTREEVRLQTEAIKLMQRQIQRLQTEMRELRGTP